MVNKVTQVVTAGIQNVTIILSQANRHDIVGLIQLSLYITGSTTVQCLQLAWSFSSTTGDLRALTMVDWLSTGELCWFLLFSSSGHSEHLQSSRSEHGSVVLFGYHIELVWHYVEGTSYIISHLSLASWLKNSNSSRGCCNMVIRNKLNIYS